MITRSQVIIYGTGGGGADTITIGILVSLLLDTDQSFFLVEVGRCETVVCAVSGSRLIDFRGSILDDHRTASNMF